MGRSLKWKKMARGLMALSLSLVVFTSCTKVAEETSANEGAQTENSVISTESKSADSSKDIVITVAAKYTEGGDAESDYYLEKVAEFNSLDNGIRVELINIGDEAAYLDRLSADFATGDPPNIFMEYGGSRVLNYIESDALLDISTYLDKDADWKNSVLSTNWTPVDFSDYGYEGIFGVPWGAYQVLLYYNKGILESNHLNIPNTFEELLEVCEQLKQKGIQAFQVGEKDNYRFGHLHSVISLKTYGANIAQDLASRTIKYDGPEMLETYSIIQDMVEKGYLGDSLMSSNAPAERASFGEGKCAFMYDTSRIAATLQDTELLKNKQIGVIPFPQINPEYKNVEMGGASSAFYITKLGSTPEEQEASVKFLRFITNSDYVNGLMKRFPNTYSIKTSVSSDNYLYNEIINAISQTREYRTDLQNYDSGSHMTNTVREALQLLAIGGTPKDVGEKIVNAIADYE